VVLGKIGIIAGGGQFPLLFIEAAHKIGKYVAVVAHRGETDQEVVEAADSACWVKLGQLGRVINFFKKEGVHEIVFLGPITKTQIFRDLFPDLKGLLLWNKIDKKQDDAILRATAKALADEGINVLESTIYLQHLLFPAGVLTKAKPTKAQIRDIEFGWRNARAIGELDIGQCVVVRNCSVVAVEAMEGTDAAILRGGALAKEKAVVVKVRKPGQDFRFDLPATGVTTLEILKKAKGAVLAVEAGQSIIFDKEKMIDEANKSGM